MYCTVLNSTIVHVETRVVDKLASEALSQATGYLGCLLCVPGMHRLDFDVVGSGTGTGSRLISKIKPERGASRRLLAEGKSTRPRTYRTPPLSESPPARRPPPARRNS